ncbi:MAG: chemotaxis protein CheD [Flammeovirgaceae bacterium]
MPSTLMVTDEPYLLTTILGSCVSVCFYDSVRQVGGMTHFLLPNIVEHEEPSPKFGDFAIQQTLLKMQALGSKRKTIIAKVFGGANQSGSSLNMGARNVALALKLLEKYSIQVVAKSVLGERGRKINFNTQTGEVLVKYI